MPRQEIPTLSLLTGVTYIGVDPGASGGISVIYPDRTVLSKPMMDTETDIWEFFFQFAESGSEAFGMIEKVHAMPGNGVAGMFKFGVNYGLLRMALTAACIPFEEVIPRTWQKKIGIQPRAKAKGDSKTEESKTAFKNRLKQKAQQLFPGVKITLANADSLLIAEYCKRKYEGKL